MKTYDQVRQILGLIEPTETMYSELDADDLPHLQRLLHDPDGWRAARAVFAASRIGSAKAHSLILDAASYPRREVRVAAAVVAPRVPSAISNEILEKLIDDEDIGVRKLTIKSIGHDASSKLTEKLQGIAAQGVNRHLKTLARERFDALRIQPR
ncbi:HEAT repeat domain-containing protein [Sphaerotilus microaerophilus]|uniref:HEAT repeat domain-containing protein n=1 Tax=Sphaerotilus microaerophilus TaxID=2914710 RepID=A0ABM7YLM1_9BURK|nr:HEAT repeat domain-containing protein [Sphaerotilus sp. FB-5]BDI05279.1 hypothetical protein CATMQ487_22490 [Sphaerotilus sp. FB-5]